MALKREKKAQKGFVSLRNIKLSVVCSKILTTPKLNFVNRLGIKLLPGENKEEKKKKKKEEEEGGAPCPASTHTHMHTHIMCVSCLTSSGHVQLAFCTMNYRSSVLLTTGWKQCPFIWIVLLNRTFISLTRLCEAEGWNNLYYRTISKLWFFCLFVCFPCYLLRAAPKA